MIRQCIDDNSTTSTTPFSHMYFFHSDAPSATNFQAFFALTCTPAPPPKSLLPLRTAVSVLEAAAAWGARQELVREGGQFKNQLPLWSGLAACCPLLLSLRGSSVGWQQFLSRQGAGLPDPVQDRTEPGCLAPNTLKRQSHSGGRSQTRCKPGLS